MELKRSESLEGAPCVLEIIFVPLAEGVILEEGAVGGNRSQRVRGACLCHF